MKINRQGQAKVLTEQELHNLFTLGLLTPRDRLLFGICLYTSCRIGEACSLRWRDIVEDTITFRIENTKTRASRSVAMSSALQGLLTDYRLEQEQERFGSLFVFRGKRVGSHLCPSMAHKILKGATERIGVLGVSTHSFRRTALTMMCRKGVNLRVIQKISGYKSLNVLAHYLEVSEQEKEAALALIEF
jgi:integrase/recombinase XerD